MMIELSEKQVNFILKDIRLKGLPKSKLTDELLDHICCGVEKEMGGGLNFKEAYQKTIVNFGPNGLIKTHQESKSATEKIALKKKTKTFGSMVAASLVFLVLAVNAKGKAEISPISKDRIKTHYSIENKFLYQILPNSPVFAIDAGRIINISRKKNGFYAVELETTNDKKLIYNLVSDLFVMNGSRVQRGEVIGKAGVNSNIHSSEEFNFTFEIKD
ncbi:MAG: M23 family metallopeptidase [Flammeovirgaceae bacterium]|nr:M23 family metallopeptidase [Flammeovirgaceae bacterium]